ncbi:MAG: DUF3857 domain-containing protein [Planctomycetes bacterium]|nr:DUF3857 domain-containing protein [Planctomycetota bacterium]
MRTRTVRITLWVGIVLSGVVGRGAMAEPPKPATAKQIEKMIAAAGESKDYDDADLVYVLDEADVYVYKSGLATTEACQVIKILTDAGVREKSVLRWDFDPDTYRVTIKSVRVHRKDGGVDEVDLGALIRHPAVQHAIYWGGIQELLSLPRLDVGDTLELRTSKIGFNIAYLADSGSGSSGAAGSVGADLIPPMAGEWYEVTLFQGKYPINNKRYTVHMPKDMPVQYEVYNGELKSSLWFGDGTLIHTWSAKDIPAIKKEPNMVARDDCVTKLVMATLGAWEEKSRWFHVVNEPQFDADDAIRAEVAKITSGLTTDEEKIAAVTHWVADNIRYYGTKQGGACEGYTLHDSRKTFRDRGGVCKDKAGMLITMLRVLGHEAYPALTQAGSRVERIPADQFNHTVTVMRKKNGDFRILDPTWVPLNRDLWSSLEQLQGLVYGTPEGQDLTQSPYYEPESNRREAHATSEIGEDGSLTTHIAFHLDGVACNRFRRYIHGRPMPERRAAFETNLNIAPNAQLVSFKHTDPYDYTEDTRVDMTVSAPGYAAAGDGVVMFRLPLMSHPLNGFFRASYLDKQEKEERKYGIYYWATRMVRYEETIKLPSGWQVQHVPEPQSMDSPVASLSFKATPGDGELTYRFEFTLKKGLISPEEYPDYKKTIDKMYEIADDWIVCTNGDSLSQPTQIARESASTGTVGGR